MSYFRCSATEKKCYLTAANFPIEVIEPLQRGIENPVEHLQWDFFAKIVNSL